MKRPLLWLSVALAVAVAAIIGCSGGGNGGGRGGGSTTSGGGGTAQGTTTGTISTGQTGAAARLYMTGRFTMSDTSYALLKQNAATLESKGYIFEDAGKDITFGRQPLRSMFLRANGQILGFTDNSGLVKTKPIPAGVDVIDVVNNIDETAILTIHAAQLGTLDHPTDIDITQNADVETVVTDMDNDNTSSTASSANPKDDEEGHCGGEETLDAKPATSSAKPQDDDEDSNCGSDCGHMNSCCLDYDGYIPSSVKPCTLPVKVASFLGSTCGMWYFQGVCRNGVEPRGDEGCCLTRHKGRWCQQIHDDQFSVDVDKKTIGTGDTAKIAIYNNTRKNSIMVELQSNLGSLETANPAPNSSGSGSVVDVAHWDGTGPYTWVPNRTVLYHAPASLPNGQSIANVTVRVYGQTGAQDLTIQVCNCSVPAGT